MMRRAVENNNNKFGMCVHTFRGGFSEYGCMLHIRDIQMLPDGRSFVDCIGEKRFKGVYLFILSCVYY